MPIQESLKKVLILLIKNVYNSIINQESKI
jgi:hypothetical protein